MTRSPPQNPPLNLGLGKRCSSKNLNSNSPYLLCGKYEYPSKASLQNRSPPLTPRYGFIYNNPYRLRGKDEYPV